MGKGLDLFEAYMKSESEFLKYVLEGTGFKPTDIEMMVYDQTDYYWNVGRLNSKINWAQLPEDVSSKKGNYYDINKDVGGGVIRKDDITVVCCYSGRLESTHSELLVFKNELEVN